MDESFEGIWRILHGKIPSGERLTAKTITTNTKTSVYCALDANGKRHLLISLGEDEQEPVDKTSRGISISTRELVLGQKCDSKKYVDIQCQHPSGHRIFNLFIADIKEVVGKADFPASAVSRVVEKWHRFWEKVPVRTLDRKAQMGLFAELRFLSEWLVPVLGLEGAVHSWQGPFGGKDFQAEKFSVEAKSSVSDDGHIYSVNSLGQLEEVPERRIYLFGILLNRIPNDGENIVSEVEKIRKMFGENVGPSDHFEKGLMRIGYSDFHSEEYKKFSFTIKEQLLFEVRDDFPRLSSGMIKIPSGVERVQYVINLNSFGHLVLANNPSEWFP